MVIKWMHLNVVSKICSQERVWVFENCTKHTFMYKAVEEKKISAGIWHIVGRKVYGGMFTWSLHEDIQICMVQYEVTKMQMSTEEFKLGQSKNHFLSLKSPKIKSHYSL